MLETFGGVLKSWDPRGSVKDDNIFGDILEIRLVVADILSSFRELQRTSFQFQIETDATLGCGTAKTANR